MKKKNIFSALLMLLGIGYVIAAFLPLIKSILKMDFSSDGPEEWVEVPMLTEK